MATKNTMEITKSYWKLVSYTTDAGSRGYYYQTTTLATYVIINGEKVGIVSDVSSAKILSTKSWLIRDLP